MAWVGIVVFVVLALNETVFGRTAKEAYQLNLQPFWSYEAIMNGRKDLIKEHYLNVAVFIPLGMLIWFALGQRKWWRALVFGCAVSMLIEVLQLVLKRGLCEFDDVMHNTLGCMIGYGVMKGGRSMINGLRSLRV
jgi:glycopeptide antibiotics resistance protein